MFGSLYHTRIQNHPNNVPAFAQSYNRQFLVETAMALLLRGTLGCQGHFYKDIEATVMLVHLLKEGLASLRREPNTTRALRRKFLPPCIPKVLTRVIGPVAQYAPFLMVFDNMPEDRQTALVAKIPWSFERISVHLQRSRSRYRVHQSKCPSRRGVWRAIPC
jgi:hypothetical protein